MEEIKFSSIKDMLEAWLSTKDERTVSGVGNIFRAKDMLTWANILKGTPGGDYIIFFNSGGAPFDIWRDDKGGALIKSFLEKDKWSVFAYRLNGVDTILRNLPEY